MSYVITDPCIDVIDKSCVEVCPVDCIHLEDGVDRMEYINPDECIDCGACEPVCPVTAIYTEDDVPADKKVFTELNANWYTDPDSVRAQVNQLKPPA
ncbi:MAG TPA: ferredoxin family protein [Dehalococcoidia bacterium]|nr:ferredoxin family protein [Dehalococcoidia bacterium]